MSQSDRDDRSAEAVAVKAEDTPEKKKPAAKKSATSRRTTKADTEAKPARKSTGRKKPPESAQTTESVTASAEQQDAPKPPAKRTASRKASARTAAKGSDSAAKKEADASPAASEVDSAPDAGSPSKKAPVKKAPAKKTGTRAKRAPSSAPEQAADAPAPAEAAPEPKKPVRSPRSRTPVAKTERAPSGRTGSNKSIKSEAAAIQPEPETVIPPEQPRSALPDRKERDAREPDRLAKQAEARTAARQRRAAARAAGEADPAAPTGEITDSTASPAPQAEAETAASAPQKSSGRSRGRGRGGSKKTEQAAVEAVATEAAAEPMPGTGIDGLDDAGEAEAAGSQAADNGEEREPRKRRRSRRGGRRRKKHVQNGENGTGDEQSLSVEGAENVEEAGPATEDLTAETPQAPKAEAAGKARGKAAKSRQAEAKATEEPVKAGKQKMLVSVLAGEQVEVVITQEGVVHEYYVEMLHQAKIKGNIYKGVISNVDANLQAAFVNYGGVKNGFLQIDEVHPEYYLVPHEATKGRKFPPIQKALKPGQEILVQVVKEPAGTKGAFLTSYLSLPGRFLVLTPGREQIGVSRKVENEEERSRLRELLQGLKPGPGLGVIVRTVSMGASKTNLQKDLQFLKRLWKDIRAKGIDAPSPSLLYQEVDLSTRAVRDYLTDDVQEVWIDDAHTAEQVMEFANILFPRKQNLIRVHDDPASSLFERFNVQKQLDQIHSREVVLPSGGRLVIDNTEALTAIDINSGRSGGKSNFEDMAYRTNLEAARMIPLQLRLRDIGGQVVADFIEMRDRDHWREVEKAVRNGMKGDRARYDVGKVGPFGMLEMVRQRLGSSAISVSTEPCPTCKGTGLRRNLEWQAMGALREVLKLIRQAVAAKQAEVVYATESELAFYLLNSKRQALQGLESKYGVRVVIGSSAGQG